MSFIITISPQTFLFPQTKTLPPLSPHEIVAKKKKKDIISLDSTLHEPHCDD